MPRPRAARSTCSTSARPTTGTPSGSTSGADIQFASRVFAAHADDLPARCDQGGAVQADSRPGHRHGHDVRRRQDVEVHDQGRRQVAGRQARHLRRRQVRHLADLRHRRHHRWPELRDLLLRHPEQRRTAPAQYAGPYKKTGQDLYDKAVTCAGNDHHVQDEQAVHRLQPGRRPSPPSAPTARTRTRARSPNYAVFSNGPYMLQGTWTTNKGGTFVRNPNWTEATDPIRKAYPDSIVYQEGIETETVVQRIMADSGRRQVRGHAGAPPRRRCRRRSSRTRRSRRVRPTLLPRTSTTWSRTSRARS